MEIGVFPSYSSYLDAESKAPKSVGEEEGL